MDRQQPRRWPPDGWNDVASESEPGRTSRPAARRQGDPWPENLAELHLEYALTRSSRLEEQLLAVYEDFALAIVRRFGNRRDRFEDLAQVARIALLNALRRFDPGFGLPFTGFARATIDGELKRHLRDRTWMLRVPRTLKDRYIQIVRANDELRHALGRGPTAAEIGRHLDLTEEQVLEGMELIHDQRVQSLDEPIPGGHGTRADPAVEDPGFATTERRELVASLLRRLPDREREILRLRFSEELTQTEIAARIGVSQMCISRTLTRSLERLRSSAN